MGYPERRDWDHPAPGRGKWRREAVSYRPQLLIVRSAAVAGPDRWQQVLNIRGHSAASDQDRTALGIIGLFSTNADDGYTLVEANGTGHPF